MDKTTYTRKDLADRWGLTEPSIIKMEHDGILTRCKNLPGVRYTAKSVYLAEEGEFNPFSPMERRRLEKENKLLQQDNDRLKGILSAITAKTAEYLGGIG